MLRMQLRMELIFVYPRFLPMKLNFQSNLVFKIDFNFMLTL